MRHAGLSADFDTVTEFNMPHKSYLSGQHHEIAELGGPGDTDL